MEEESWASCGNRDYLTPWDLSSLSTKSSPMLSMMLGVEGEDGPSCNSWSPSLMCMNIIFNVSSPLLPQFPSTSSCTKSWSQSLLHIVVASFNSSLSHCCLIFTNFSFNFQNRTCTETLLHCEVHEFSFPTSPYSPKIDSEQESYVHFIPALQSVPTNFRTRNVQCSCHISLYGSSNSLILDALEREFHGASEYQLFLPCTSLSMCKIWWKQRGLLSNFGDVDEFDFFFDHEFMGTLCHACKTIQVHNLPPRWQLGVETIANKPTIPKISNCGIASLAKK